MPTDPNKDAASRARLREAIQTDAPSDGTPYSRQNGAWVAASGGSSGFTRWMFSDFMSDDQRTNGPFRGSTNSGGNVTLNPANRTFNTSGVGWCMFRSGANNNSGYRWDSVTPNNNFQAGHTFRVIFNTYTTAGANIANRIARFGLKNNNFDNFNLPNTGVYFDLVGYDITPTLRRTSGTVDTGAAYTLAADTSYLLDIYANSGGSFTFTIYPAPSGNSAPSGALNTQTLTMSNALDTSIALVVGMGTELKGTAVQNTVLMALDYMGFGYL